MGQEIWKDIKGYEGLYQVSNYGKIKSLSRHIIRINGNYLIDKDKLLKQKKNPKGYVSVSLCKKGVIKYRMIHRLVAEAFIPNPNNYPCVNHKNENKVDNRLENLEWCSYTYNNEYNNRAKKVGVIKSKPIYHFTVGGDFINIYKNSYEAEKETNISRRTIIRCCKKEKNNYKNHVFLYETEVVGNGYKL